MRRSLFALMAAGLLLVACGDDRLSGPAATTASPSATVPATSDSANPDSAAPGSAVLDSATPDETTAASPEAAAALQFSAPTVGGGDIDFRAFAGRTVALWFWAPT